MPLQIEHRPKTLDDITGNKAIKNSLESIFARKSDFPHAYLFHGPTGCGKTTLARIVASMLKCESPTEYNMSNLRSIDDVRGIIEESLYMPIIGNTKVYILDEVHRQTKDAQNAFLKPLEDPPNHVFYILCTTVPQALIDTIRGRCHTYQVKPLLSSDMMILLKSILTKEKIKDYPESILKEIIRLSEGLPRNALIMLDAVIDIIDEDSAIAALSSVALSDADTKELCQSIIRGEPWDKVRENLKAILTEYEPEKVRQAICGYLLSTLLNSKSNDRVSAMLDVFSETNFYTPKLLANQVYVALKMK
jgi:DNA polymerase III subunit gamma/tau